MKLEFIEAGEIVSTHGVRGEMKLLPWVDSPEFMLQFERVWIKNSEYKISRCRVQKTCNLIQLAGIETVEEAQSLRGSIVKVYRDDVQEDVVFAGELINMDVYALGTRIGKITDVLDYPSNKVYVVSGEKEYMLPAVKEFILSTDVANNRMDVRMIEGMEVDEN